LRRSGHDHQRSIGDHGRIACVCGQGRPGSKPWGRRAPPGTQAEGRAQGAAVRASRMGAALAWASATSASGSLPQVMPPPAHTCRRCGSAATVRMVNPRSRPSGPSHPKAPIAGPRPTGSRAAITSSAASFGAPAPFAALADYEGVIEASYKAQMAAWWTLQVSLQRVFHPGGSGALPNATVLIFQTTVRF